MKKKLQILTVLLSFMLGISLMAKANSTNLKSYKKIHFVVENYTNQDFLLNVIPDNKDNCKLKYSDLKNVTSYGLDNNMYIKHDSSYFECSFDVDADYACDGLYDQSKLDLKAAETYMLDNNEPDYIKFLLADKENLAYMNWFGDFGVVNNFHYDIDNAYNVVVRFPCADNVVLAIMKKDQALYNFKYVARNYTNRDISIRFNGDKKCKILPNLAVDKTDSFGGIIIPAETDSLKGDFNMITSVNNRSNMKVGLKCWYSAKDNKMGAILSYLSNKENDNAGDIQFDSDVNYSCYLTFNVQKYTVNMVYKLNRGIYVSMWYCAVADDNDDPFLIEICDKDHPPKHDFLNINSEFMDL